MLLLVTITSVSPIGCWLPGQYFKVFEEIDDTDDVEEDDEEELEERSDEDSFPLVLFVAGGAFERIIKLLFC